MASAEYYRAEAKRCRELAAHSISGSTMAAQWLKIAAEYETLAEALEAPGFMAGSRMTSQPMQQQQAKAKPEDDK
jgi:hypothetical protein